jgi:hypothetical protein
VDVTNRTGCRRQRSWQVEAILRNDAVYELAALITDGDPQRGGKRRLYPAYMLIVYEALISVYRSARRVESEIAHPLVWNLMRRVIRERFARGLSQWLPAEPMRRHHYLYGRNRLLVPIREQLRDLLEVIAARQAVGHLGLCDPDGAGSATHPELTRMLYADGKVITPLWKAKAGERRLDKKTGELRSLRYEADAALHITGSGEPAWGTKHVMVATRGDDIHSRMILSVAPVAQVGREADIALRCIGRVSSQLPGALGVLYDGAFRGGHLLELLRDRGLLPIVPVQAKAGGRRAKQARVERSVLVGPGTLSSPDGTRDVILYARAGALCLGELNADGDVGLTPLERLKLEPRRNADRTWRWYGIYQAPATHGSGTVRVRLDTTDDDRKRGFNRCEHLRPIPPSDPEYPALYHRRSDAESINRALDDSSWLGRAHSVGRDRQLLNLLGYAIAVNSLTLHRHQAGAAPPNEIAA